jgi:uracil-DNA glycosylase family protein
MVCVGHGSSFHAFMVVRHRLSRNANIRHALRQRLADSTSRPPLLTRAHEAASPSPVMPAPSDKLPAKADLDACRRCPLGERATQGVPGEGPRRARIMLVGEQPGDEEDVKGRPFVGPAGRLLRRALEEAGIPDEVFVTNAVKHFSFELRGKRRIHKTPAQREIAACQTWLEAELAAVRPRLIVTLGATALGAVLGRRMTIGDARAAAELRHPSGARLVATFHPSAVLRAPDEDRRRELYKILVGDLARAARLAETEGASSRA